MVRFINSRLSIPARLWLMVTVSTVPDVLLTGLFIQQSLIEISFAQKEFEGSTYLADLWHPFIAIAERGSLETPTPTSAATDEKFSAGDAAKAYQAADTIPAKLEAGKTLIGAVADGSNLTLDPDLDSFYAMDAATVRLPGIVTAAVALGKAAAESPLDPQRLIHIAFAVNRLEISAGDADASLGAAMKNNAAGLTKSALAGATDGLKAASTALSTRGHALLDGAKVDDLAAAQAALLQKVDIAWGATNTELGRLLKVRTDGFYRKLAISLFIAGASLVVAAWLSQIISRGLSKRVARLVGVMDRLILNDIMVTVPYLGDRNETGRIAKTLVAFKESVVERNKLKSESAYADEQAQVVGAVAAGLERLSGGDLTATLSRDFPPQFEKIRVDFDATVSTLGQAMRTIADSAEAIRLGTSGIAAAAANLSLRNDRQAATLGASTSALEQLAASIGQSAGGAITARQTVSAAKSEAEQSESVVLEAIAAMSDIEQSSDRIRHIIGFIDQLAAQTNLLALNAAIEAARAGDAGRGFAIVAAEVRELAQHSTKSAGQIRTLISAAAQQVHHGASLVGATGRALERIVAHVGETTSAIGGIAEVTSIQSMRLQDTNEAFSEMDRVTQQNITTVEEVTEAALSLSRETDRLAQLVGRFKIDDVPGRSTRSRLK